MSENEKPADYFPATLKPLVREGGRITASIAFDERFALVWAMESIKEAKRELVAMLVSHVMESLTADRERMLKMVVESIAESVKDEISKAVAARLTK